MIGRSLGKSDVQEDMSGRQGNLEKVGVLDGDTSAYGACTGGLGKGGVGKETSIEQTGIDACVCVSTYLVCVLCISVCRLCVFILDAQFPL